VISYRRINGAPIRRAALALGAACILAACSNDVAPHEPGDDFFIDMRFKRVAP
jgi:hypothetical protein